MSILEGFARNALVAGVVLATTSTLEVPLKAVFFNDAGVGPAVARKRLEGLAQNVGKIVRGMDESHPGWKSVSPIVLGNCARVLSLGE